VITLGRSSVEPFLQFSARRDLREKIFRAWIARGTPAARPTTKPTLRKCWRCAPSARGSWAMRASHIIALTTPWRRRREPCATCWNGSGRRRARVRLQTATPMQAMIREQGGNFELAPWDWRYLRRKTAPAPIATSMRPPFKSAIREQGCGRRSKLRSDGSPVPPFEKFITIHDQRYECPPIDFSWSRSGHPGAAALKSAQNSRQKEKPAVAACASRTPSLDSGCQATMSWRFSKRGPNKADCPHRKHLREWRSWK